MFVTLIRWKKVVLLIVSIFNTRFDLGIFIPMMLVLKAIVSNEFNFSLKKKNRSDMVILSDFGSMILGF